MSDSASTSTAATTSTHPSTTTVTPYLSVNSAVAALDFYRRAFGARETSRMMQPDGRVGHAEIAIGGATVMLADEFLEIGFVCPTTLGGTTVSIVLEVPNVDEVAAQAVAAGATMTRPLEDQFYGYRTCTLMDPFGHRWHVHTRIADLSLEEVQRRAATDQARA